MATHTTFWHDVRRAVAQWVGIAVASVLAGLLLGVILRKGINETRALEIALPVGFSLALVFWVLASLWFHTKALAVQVAVSSNEITLEGQSVWSPEQREVGTVAVITYSAVPVSSMQYSHGTE